MDKSEKLRGLTTGNSRKSLLLITSFLCLTAFSGTAIAQLFVTSPFTSAPQCIAPNIPPGCQGAPPETSCDPEVMDAIDTRGYIEAQRETMQNQNFILRPDSVLEYSCIDSLLYNFATGVNFSEIGWIGAIGKLGIFALDQALLSTAIAFLYGNLPPTIPARGYLAQNFAGPMYGGRAALTDVYIPAIPFIPYTAQLSTCNYMQRIWSTAKCMNFMDEENHDGFYDFAWYTGLSPQVSFLTNDPRTLNTALGWFPLNSCTNAAGTLAAAAGALGGNIAAFGNNLGTLTNGLGQALSINANLASAVSGINSMGNIPSLSPVDLSALGGSISNLGTVNFGGINFSNITGGAVTNLQSISGNLSSIGNSISATGNTLGNIGGGLGDIGNVLGGDIGGTIGNIGSGIGDLSAVSGGAAGGISSLIGSFNSLTSNLSSISTVINLGGIDITSLWGDLGTYASAGDLSKYSSLLGDLSTLSKSLNTLGGSFSLFSGLPSLNNLLNLNNMFTMGSFIPMGISGNLGNLGTLTNIGFGDATRFNLDPVDAPLTSIILPYNTLLPGGGYATCAQPIFTGVCVNMVPSAMSNGPTPGPYMEGVCPNPGCHYDVPLAGGTSCAQTFNCVPY